MSQYHFVAINCHRPSRSVVLFSTQDRDVGRTSVSTSGSRRSSLGYLSAVGIRGSTWSYLSKVRSGLSVWVSLLLGRPAVSNGNSSGPFFICRRRHPRASLGTPPMGFPNSSCGRPKGTFGSRGRRRDAQRIVASLLGARRPGLGWSKASPNGHPFRGGLTLP